MNPLQQKLLVSDCAIFKFAFPLENLPKVDPALFCLPHTHFDFSFGICLLGKFIFGLLQLLFEPTQLQRQLIFLLSEFSILLRLARLVAKKIILFLLQQSIKVMEMLVLVAFFDCPTEF